MVFLLKPLEEVGGLGGMRALGLSTLLETTLPQQWMLKLWVARAEIPIILRE